MKDRIKQIRKDLKLNQTDFAANVNLSRMMIAHVEAGDANLSDRSIKDICRVYKVNEEWLRTGEGDPYKQMTRNQAIAAYMNDIMESPDDEFAKEFIYGLTKLDVEDWRKIAEIINKMTH